MRITVPEIDYLEGFTTTNDIFQRKKLSKQLENIIDKSEDENLVLALNDEWGNGKTTFLKMWESEIKKDDKFQVVYFDAFTNDFQNDPFIAISAHIYSKISEVDLKKKYLDATKKVATTLLKATLKVGVGALTLGLVKGTEIESIGSELKEAIDSPLEKFIEDKVTQLEEENKSIEHLKSVLSEIATEKKLIFIVDELDRARPNFSLELLERIKHVFNTENIFFVLSMNKEQFKHSIVKSYGNIDAEIYLSKFVHLWFTLPDIHDELNESYTLDIYLRYINSKLSKQTHQIEDSLKILSYLLRINNRSLRDAERCYSLLLIALASYSKMMTSENQISLSIVVYLKQLDDKSLKSLLNKTSSKKIILQKLNVHSLEGESFYIQSAINTEFFTDEEFRNARQVQDNENPVFINLHGRRFRALSAYSKLLENIEIS